MASRIYTYANLTAYETLRLQKPGQPTLTGRIREFEQVPAPEQREEYCYPLASVKAFIAVSKAQTYSIDMWEEYEAGLDQEYVEMNIPQDVMLQ